MKRNFSRAFPPATERQRQQSLSEARSSSKGHGRLVKRHLQASSRLAEHLDWPGLGQVCRLERITICQGKQTTEVQHAIASLSPQRVDAASLSSYWCSHWGIESLHWLRDVTFGEDKCQVKTGHAPQNLAAFRNAVISLLRSSGYQEIASTLRHFSRNSLKLLTFLGIMKK